MGLRLGSIIYNIEDTCVMFDCDKKKIIFTIELSVLAN